MKSPFTGKEMKIIREVRTLPYRKDTFNVKYHAYECMDTKERFTDDELDMINIIQVHNQYREKYGIPFPEEIRHIREKYEVSAKKMSEILGLGSNAYRLYESGEMPTVSNGRLIMSIKDPEDFRRQITFSAHMLKDSEYSKLIKNAERLIDIENDAWRRLQDEEMSVTTVDDTTGFKMRDLEKAVNVLAFFANEKIELFKTKVNKLLFYTDFLNFQKTGMSMCGLNYRAISYGPVPVDYEKIYKQFYDEMSMDIIEVQINHDYAEKFIMEIPFKSELFDENEIKVLHEVAKRFKGKNTTEIVDISHQENAWMNNKDNRNIISYTKYAYELRAFES